MSTQEHKPQMSPERRRALRPYLAAKHEAISQEAALGADAWLWYRSGLTDYEKSFKSLFSEPSECPLLDWVDHRRANGKPIIALDLMSEGQALRTLGADRGLAVTLFDHRRDRERLIDRDHIDQIQGDLLKRSTWTEIQAWLQQYGGTHHAADLIMERGIGPITTLPEDPKLLGLLLNNLYTALSPDDGMMVLEIPKVAFGLAKKLAEHLRGVSGVEMQLIERVPVHGTYDNSGLRLVRHVDSPDHLPDITP